MSPACFAGACVSFFCFCYLLCVRISRFYSRLLELRRRIKANSLPLLAVLSAASTTNLSATTTTTTTNVTTTSSHLLLKKNNNNNRITTSTFNNQHNQRQRQTFPDPCESSRNVVTVRQASSSFAKRYRQLPVIFSFLHRAVQRTRDIAVLRNASPSPLFPSLLY